MTSLLKLIWEREYVPPELVRAAFVMIYKNKGSRDDPSKYRCIGLLPHAYKILSLVMLERVMKECSDYLSDWQAGFRPERGCRDNILLLRVLCDQIIKNDSTLFVTYIDYSAAFDSISHKFLDRSLASAGASRKTRAIFRAIYAAAEGIARVNGLHGNNVYSETFKVRWGVIQGDIISPIFFILAMEQIFRIHDNTNDSVAIGNYLQVGVLGYADDAAMTSLSATRLSERLSSVSRGSREDADMDIHKGKTKNMIVERQEKVKPPSVQAIMETEAGYRHECEFCGRRCKTARGLKIHQTSCDKWHGLTDEEYIIKRINAVFGTPKDRWFRVEWLGHEGKDSWEPERSLMRQGCEESIKTFWESCDLNPSEEFIADPDDIWRCWTCGKGYKTSGSLKAHITHSHSDRCYHGSTADKETRAKLHAEAQELKCHVVCEGKQLENVWLFKYLGSRFRADGDQIADVKARIATATATAGKMRAIWSSRSTPIKLKLRIYKSGVCSRLTYGSETWRLDERTCAMLNGANSRMVARITNKTPHEEASPTTRSFDVVRWIRARRLTWVGHILRMDADRLVHKAIKFMSENRSTGDLLMDVPKGFTWDEMQKLTSDRVVWRGRVNSLRNGPRVTVDMNEAVPGRIAPRRSARLRQPQAPNNPKQVVSPSARKYLARDAHEAFFRPGGKGKQKRSRHQTKPKKKGKNPPKTDKERVAWAREHYRLHHGSISTPDSPPCVWSPPAILGHHQPITVTSPPLRSLKRPWHQ